MKTSDGTPALISSNNINQVLNVFIPYDNSIQEGWLPPTKRASAAKIN